MLKIDPAKRITVKEALNHNFFKNKELTKVIEDEIKEKEIVSKIISYLNDSYDSE